MVILFGYILILGGAVTEIRRMLLSMNFEVQSTLHTYSGGLTDIRSSWKLKEEADLFVRNGSGSQATWIPVNGTLN